MRSRMASWHGPAKTLAWCLAAAAAAVAVAQQNGVMEGNPSQQLFKCVGDATCWALALAGLRPIGAEGLQAADIQHLLNDSSCCGPAGPAQALDIRIAGEMTPQLPLLRWMVDGRPKNKLPILVPTATVQAVEFVSSDGIRQYLNSWEQDYAMVVREAQFYYYANGLDLWWSNQTDNRVQDPVSPRGLLYPRLTLMLMYHPGVLDAFSIVPDQLTTWEGLLAVADTLHGKDYDGDGQPDYAFCLDLKQGCSKAVYLYAAIAATFIQVDGPASGFHWHPPNMTQLVLQPLVVQQVARVLGRLASLAQPTATTDCSAVNTLFASKTSTRCAFTFDWDLVAGLLGPSQVNGMDQPGSAQPFGALLTPGSTTVFDRTSSSMVTCSEATCPRAKVEPTPSGPSLVNRAPYSLMACPDSRPSIQKPLEVQLAASQLWIPVQNVMRSWVRIRDDIVRDGLPVKCSPQGDGRSNCSSLWQSPPGMDLQETQRWPALPSANSRPTLSDMQRTVPALWQAYVHPNPAPDLAVPLSTFFSSVLDELAVNISRLGSSAPDRAAEMQAVALAKWKQVSARASSSDWNQNTTAAIGAAATTSSSDTSYLKDWYWKSIGYTPPPDLTNRSNEGMPPHLLATACVVPVVCAMLLLLAAAFLRRRPRNRTLFGAIKPPGVSLETTLLITDIFNSTVLWEGLPAAVMDEALRLHHEILRSTAVQCDGYESGAGEGDSFILAFHTPHAAAKFALQAQSALLEAPWSSELLSHPDAREVWVQLGSGATPSSKLHPAPSHAALRFSGPGFHTPLVDSLGLARGLGRGRKSWAPRSAARMSRTVQRIEHGSDPPARGLARLRQWFSGSRGGHPSVSAPSVNTGLHPDEQQEQEAGGLGPAAPDTPTGRHPASPGSSPVAWVRRATSLKLLTSQSARGMSPDSCVLPAPRVSASRARRSSDGGIGYASRDIETGVQPLLPGGAGGAQFMSDRQLEPLGDDDDDDDEARPDQGSINPTSLASSKRWGASRAAGEMSHLGGPGLQHSASGRHLLAAYAQADMPCHDDSQALAPANKVVVRGSSRFLPPSQLTSPSSQRKPSAASLTSSPLRGSPDLVLLPPTAEDASRSATSQAASASLTSQQASLQALQQEADAGPDSQLITPGTTETLSRCTWRQRLLDFWPLTPPHRIPPAGSGLHTADMTCIQRGLRVRMGMHSGVLSETDITLNRVTQSWAYGGTSIKLAKAVADAAAGGMVLLSASSFVLLAHHLSSLPGEPLPVYLGDAALQVPSVLREQAGEEEEEEQEATAQNVPLYCLVTPELRPRLAHQEPLRGLDMTQLGNLEAPTGCVTICFLYVVGASGLVAELGPTASAALHTFQLLSSQLCCEYGGYVVEATEGLCLVAFADPAACTLWALACCAHMQQHGWEPALLAHELCQEVVTLDPVTNELTWQHRGPRLRAGMHVGSVEVHVNRRTGRMAYRGRVMNRAARIASKAQDGQVLSSAAAVTLWQPQQDQLEPASSTRTAADQATGATPGAPTLSLAAQPGTECPSVVQSSRHLLRATSVGTFALKGVSEIMQLFDCSLDAHAGDDAAPQAVQLHSTP